MKRPVAFAEDCIGPKAETAIAAMKDGAVTFNDKAPEANIRKAITAKKLKVAQVEKPKGKK